MLHLDVDALKRMYIFKNSRLESARLEIDTK